MMISSPTALRRRPRQSGHCASAASGAVPVDSAVQRRSRRVVILLIGIVLLSVADLLITLAFLRSTGMMEANPLAAMVIRWTESSWSLACYKLLTVTVCVVLLMKLRSRLATEVAAWCGLAVLAFMSVQWHQYATHVDGHQNALLATGGNVPGDEWLMLD